MIKFTGNEQFDKNIAIELYYLGFKDVTDENDKRKGKLLLIHNGFSIKFDYINIYFIDDNLTKQINSNKVVEIAKKVISLKSEYDDNIDKIIAL